MSFCRKQTRNPTTGRVPCLNRLRFCRYPNAAQPSNAGDQMDTATESSDLLLQMHSPTRIRTCSVAPGELNVGGGKSLPSDARCNLPWRQRHRAQTTCMLHLATNSRCGTRHEDTSLSCLSFAASIVEGIGNRHGAKQACKRGMFSAVRRSPPVV